MLHAAPRSNASFDARHPWRTAPQKYSASSKRVLSGRSRRSLMLSARNENTANTSAWRMHDALHDSPLYFIVLTLIDRRFRWRSAAPGPAFAGRRQ
jgi:hypothetical protein